MLNPYPSFLDNSTFINFWVNIVFHSWSMCSSVETSSGKDMQPTRVSQMIMGPTLGMVVTWYNEPMKFNHKLQMVSSGKDKIRRLQTEEWSGFVREPLHGGHLHGGTNEQGGIRRKMPLSRYQGIVMLDREGSSKMHSLVTWIPAFPLPSPLPFSFELYFCHS